MNAISEQLGVTCTSSIGLMTIVYTCFDGHKTFTNSLCLNNTGVNTSKLDRLERFVKKFPTEGVHKSGEQLHQELDEIEKIRGLCTLPSRLGLAAAFACAAFTFLLGGGPVEMLCAFIGAGAGNFLRSKLIGKHFTLYLCVDILCGTGLSGLRRIPAADRAGLFLMAGGHEVGYICAMLFIIPGFPFITSGIDLAKLDMRSGLERLAYAVIIVGISTITAWVMALILNLSPGAFADLGLSPALLLRLTADHKFCQGSSDSPSCSTVRCPIAASAAVIGAVANTLRLELVDLAGLPRSCRCFYRSTDSRPPGLSFDEKTGIPENIRDSSIHRYHGSRIVSVPGGLQYGGDVSDPLRPVACIRTDDHYGAAAGTDRGKDHNRQGIPSLYINSDFSYRLRSRKSSEKWLNTE